MEYQTCFHDKMMTQLSNIAQDVNGIGSARLAAAIVHKRDIVSIGINKRKSHPFQKKYGKNQDAIFLHAEILAIHNALKRISPEELSKSSLYVCRMRYTDQTKRGMEYGLACPCDGCKKAIAAFEIKNVFYTQDVRGIDFL